MFAGCLGSNDEGLPVADDLDVGVQTLIGGIFQNVKFSASNDLSVYIPYLIMNPDSGYVQNSTIIDIKKGSSGEVSILAIRPWLLKINSKKLNHAYLTEKIGWRLIIKNAN